MRINHRGDTGGGWYGSGARWYVTNANQMLALRCAKYHGTFDQVLDRYRRRLHAQFGQHPPKICTHSCTLTIPPLLGALRAPSAPQGVYRTSFGLRGEFGIVLLGDISSSLTPGLDASHVPEGHTPCPDSPTRDTGSPVVWDIRGAWFERHRRRAPPPREPPTRRASVECHLHVYRQRHDRLGR